MDIFDGSTGLCSTATFVQARDYLTASSVGNRVLFAGGIGTTNLNEVDIYTDLSVFTTTP